MIKNYSHINLITLACAPSTCQGGFMSYFQDKNNDKIPKNSFR